MGMECSTAANGRAIVDLQAGALPHVILLGLEISVQKNKKQPQN
jgi:hypothetical protein